MRRNNTTFIKHCNERLRNCLITGIPKIVSTKNPQRKAFKFIVFFLSIVGFLWQTYTFLEIYLKYPVVQHLVTEEPEEFTAPAVTLCNGNRVKIHRFCELMPDSCQDLRKHLDLKFICMFWRRYCPAVRPENFTVKMVLKDNDVNNQSNEFLQAVGPQSHKDIVGKCSIERNAQSIPCKDSIMIQISNDGLPYKCFTFFSLIPEPNKSPENLSLTDYYKFRLNMHPEEKTDYKEVPGIYISVHDPRRLKNPMAHHLFVTSGLSYRLYVTMEHRQNLPPPFETNCVDYITLWKKNGGQGPLTKTDCMQICMMDAMLEQRGCLNKSIFYPNNFTLCPRNESDYVSEELLEKCESSCLEGCDVTEYTVRDDIIEKLWEKLCQKGDRNCEESYLDLEFNFNRLKVTRLKSEPMFTSEDLFSHIGGYMGLWLGISFIALFDSVEMLLDIIAYPVLKWRKMKTKIVSDPDCKRNE